MATFGELLKAGASIRRDGWFVTEVRADVCRLDALLPGVVQEAGGERELSACLRNRGSVYTHSTLRVSRGMSTAK